MKTYLTLAALVSLCVSPVFATYYYTAGHADIGLGEHDEVELHLHAHGGAMINGSPLSGDQEFEPGDIVIVVPNSTLFSRPPGTQWDFLGNSAGDETWALPTSHVPDTPYLGIGAEEVDKGVFVDDLLTLTLIAVDGPGMFSVYKTSMSQPTVYMTGSNGSDANGTIVLSAGEHDHFNIAFSEAGWYQITFESSAVDQATLERMAGSETFTFLVVPEPATLILLGLGGLLIRRTVNRRPGSTGRV